MQRSRFHASKMSPYNTRSMPLENRPEEKRETSRLGKASAVVSRERLRRQRGGIERASAWIVLFLSLLGTIAAFAGGWTPLIAGIVNRQLPVAAIVGGLALQAVLTFLEWYYFDSPLVSWPARLFDTIMTAIGYGPLVLMPLVTLLATRGVPQYPYVAWLIIGLVSLVIAWYPESRLVD